MNMFPIVNHYFLIAQVKCKHRLGGKELTWGGGKKIYRPMLKGNNSLHAPGPQFLGATCNLPIIRV